MPPPQKRPRPTAADIAGLRDGYYLDYKGILYFDLQVREEEEPVPQRRLRLPWRPSPAPSS